MSDINKEELGYRIKEIRVSRKETLEEFAEQIKKKTDFKIKTTKSNVSKWEKGLNIPNDITLKAISELGGVSTFYLLYGEYTSKDLMNKKALTMLDHLNVNDANRKENIIKFLISNDYDSIDSLDESEQFVLSTAISSVNDMNDHNLLRLTGNVQHGSLVIAKGKNIKSKKELTYYYENSFKAFLKELDEYIETMINEKNDTEE